MRLADRMGQAYYGNFFRWFEIGRTEFFRALGLAYREIEERGILLPVSETWAKYHSPALYDETIVIETSVDPGVRAGIKFDYPETGWRPEGGFEDRHATTAFAYREVFRLARRDGNGHGFRNLV